MAAKLVLELVETNRANRSQVIDEDLFKGFLLREQKCADRSNQPLLLLSATFDNETHPDSSAWAVVIAGLSAVTRETDVIGWLDSQKTLCVILTETRTSEEILAPALASRLRNAFAKLGDLNTADRLSIRFETYPPQGSHADQTDVGLSPTLPARASQSAYGTWKRAFDLFGSGLLLAALSPLLLLIGALVKLTSRGPVFFRQTRIGHMAKPFTIFKFRTMHANADHALHREFVTNFIKSTGVIPGAGEDEPFKLAHDPRVTTVGRILRKTSLDELPQLWNVFRGDMSLVGPRPPLQYEVDHYQGWHRRRIIEAKPGLTGLWQIAGRSRTTFDDMVRLDLRYAKMCSLSTDLKILLATPGAVFEGKGAR